MILSKSAYRCSLFGGGTDYPQWFRQHGGSVLGFTIDKYCYISIRTLPPFFEHKYRIVYSQIELPNEITDINHKSVRAVLEGADVKEGLEIHHFGDLPARSGMGTSSAFTVSVVNALAHYQRKMLDPHCLASKAIDIEQNKLMENVGCQDQIFAAYGGFNFIEFPKDGNWKVTPVAYPQELNDYFLLFFTGISRTSSVVAANQLAQMEKHGQQYAEMAVMAAYGKHLLEYDYTPPDIGKLLHEAWKLKRELSDGVSNPMIDGAYQAARDAGAIGGKLLGAGGGGFLLIFAEPDKHCAIRERLKSLVHVPFKIGNQGSTVTEY